MLLYFRERHSKELMFCFPSSKYIISQHELSSTEMDFMEKVFKSVIESLEFWPEEIEQPLAVAFISDM